MNIYAHINENKIKEGQNIVKINNIINLIS